MATPRRSSSKVDSVRSDKSPSVRLWFVRAWALCLAHIIALGPPLTSLAQATELFRAADAATHAKTDGGLATSVPKPIAPVAAEMQRPPPGSAAPLEPGPIPVPIVPRSVALLGASPGTTNDPWALFDGRAKTRLTAQSSEPVRIRAELMHPQPIGEVAVFGRAQGTLTVWIDDGRKQRRLDGLTDVQLGELDQGWTHFTAHDRPIARAVIVEWTPAGELGPPEVALWTHASANNTVPARELADAVLAQAVPGAVTLGATREVADVARISGSRRLSLPLTTDPRAVARAFLVYELRGVGHFTSVPRRINDGTLSGSTSGGAGDGGLQVEEIATEWLKPGINHIEFHPAAPDVAAGYRVQNVRIVGVPHGRVLEPFPDDEKGDRYALELERGTIPRSAFLDLTKETEARLAIAGGAGKQRHVERAKLSGLKPGIHRFDLAPDPANGDRLTFRFSEKDKTRRPGRLRVVTDVLGDGGPAIRITYPLHGECRDGKARIFGFVSDARGPARLRVDGRPVLEDLPEDGSFFVEVDEPASRTPTSWRVTLEALDAGGARAERTVDLEACQAHPGENDRAGLSVDEGAPFSQLVTPDRAHLLSFAGARLEIPEGAVAEPTRITIRPLVGDQVEPMDRAAQNVTPGARAFRFGPHGLKFEKPIKITLPYDRAAFRPGLDERDLHALYFDEQRRGWRRIGRYDRPEQAELTSLTDHFTDFVNATIAQPDSPGSRSFNPNEMKGLELADPGAGVSLVEPPEANSRGSAQLIHPIEVPPGRGGIEPSLAIAYDSDADNGWLGMGWDLSLSSIEVDTRFGVPAYQGNELYLLDGQQLTPCTPDLAHLGPCATPDPNRFVRRIEGSFDRIERTGSSPEDYAFIVTSKIGTKFFYGQTPAARLSDPTQSPGPIFRWYLERIEDTFGNSLEVEYFTDQGDNGEPFVQIYPRRIHYTSHPQRPAAYHVDFFLEGDDRTTPAPDPTPRSDVLITGRPGFQVLTRYRLGSVDVRLGDDEVIRTYDLSYDPAGDFEKSMLEAVALRGLGTSSSPGEALYEHRFEYYKAPRTNDEVEAFGAYQKWGTSHRQDDGLTRTDDESGGGSGGGGIGIGPISITASGGGFTGTERTRLAMLDLDGDGMPDLLDHRGRASFNALRGVPADDHLFQDDVLGLWTDALGHLNRTGWMVEGGLNVAGFGAGAGYTRSTTEEDRITSDINGDGWPDLVRVEDNEIFVRLNDGRGNFAADTEWGTLALDQAPSGLGEFAADPSVQSAFHLVDPLVRWTAPFSGQVTVGGTLQKIEAGGDGVVARIYHNDAEIWQHAINGDDTSTCVIGAGNSCDASGITVTVTAGDRIYTRLNANNTPSQTDPLRTDLTFDEVDWQSTIDYDVAASLADIQEPYGAFVYRFDHMADHRLAGKPRMPWVPSSTGTVRITGNVAKATTADSVVVEIIKRTGGSEQVVLSEELSAGVDGIAIDTMGPTSEGLEVAVEPDDRLEFRVLSDSPIDPGRVAWDPLITYLDYCRGDPDTGTAVCGPVLCSTSPEGEVTCLVENDPAPDAPLPGAVIFQSPEVYAPVYQTLPQSPTTTHFAATTGTAAFECTFFKPPTPEPVHVLVQGVHRLIHRRTFAANAFVAETYDCGSADITSGEQLFFTVLSEEAPVGALLTASVDGAAVPIDAINYRYRDPSFDAALTTPGLEDLPADPFSGGFHRWFAAHVNGSVPFAEGSLVFPTITGSTLLVAVPSRAGLPDVPEPLWLTGSANAYIGAARMNPSRVSAVGAVDANGSPLVAGLRKSETYNVDFSASAGGAGIQLTKGATSSHLDFLDMNGDGFADSVSNDGVAFNDGVSGFGTTFGGMAMPSDSMRRIEQRSAGASINAGGSLINQTDSRGKTKSLLATSVNIGVNYGLSGTKKDLVDINGDGLPDHVRRSNSGLEVRLNLGSRFGGPILWAEDAWEKDRVNTDGAVSTVATTLIDAFFDDVSTNEVRLQDTSGRTVGAGIDSGVFGVGGSAGVTYTVARDIVELADINGDGLVDHVMKDPDESFFRVKLNLGDRFDEERHWPVPSWSGRDIDPGGLTFIGGADTVGFHRSKSYNGSFSVEFCFFACVKASGFYSRGSGYSQMDFQDIDGDGKVDHVLKLDGENEVYAKLNQLGETGLLKRVIRPLGASFTLTYAREGNEVAFESATATRPSVDMPQNQWVLAEVVVDDTPSNTQYERSFSYREGALGTGFYDRVERENYGYALHVTTREDASEVEVRSHNSDYYRQGLAFDTIERAGDGRLFVRDEMTYRVPTGSEPTFTGAFFPAEERRTTSWYEGSTDLGAPGKSTAESRQWDEFGNLESLTEEGDDGTADDIVYTIGYFEDASAYILKADDIEARDLSGKLHRKRTAEFEMGTGKLLSLTNVVTGGTHPDTQAPYVDEAATWNFQQDTFGNFIEVTDPLGTTTTYGYDDLTETYRDFTEDAFGYQSTSVPDYRFGIPTEVTDTNHHKATFLFDDWGRPAKVFGPNDQSPGSTPTIAYSYALQPGIEPSFAWARTAHKDVTHDDDPEIVTVTFVDGLERVLQTKKDLERDTGTGTEVGMTVSGRVAFDARGRIEKQGQPIFSPLPETDFVAQAVFRNPTHTEYDILSRPTRVRTPDSEAPGGYAETTSTYAFGELDGRTTFMTTVVDPLGNQRITHTDVEDSIIGVEEFNEIDGQLLQLITRYAYNPVNELISVTDAAGNVSEASYDTLGRMIALSSPDADLTEWSYDLAGNLGAKQTGKLREASQRIRYEYVNNRLERIDYPASEDVSYVYGTPEQFGDANGNIAGRIAEERSEGGIKSLKYDRFGNIVEHSMTFTRVRTPELEPYSATVRYEFDSFARLLKMHFPGEGAEEVTYNYDRGGLVTHVFGVNTAPVHPPKGSPLTFYVLFAGYDEFEQRTRLVHGNGVETRYTYNEETRRLTHVDSDHRDPFLVEEDLPPRPLQKLAYEYDLVGNIVELRNDAPFDDLMENVFVATTTQTFDYDGLYQLKTAEGIYQENSDFRQRYSLFFDYDAIGNIREKNQQSFRDLPNEDGTWEIDQPNSDEIYRSVYTYDGPRPHAPTRIDEHLDNDSQVYVRELSYDASGNQTGFVYHHSDVREIDWNEENRLSEVRSQGNEVTRVLYDGDGMRAVHVSYFGNHETAYLGQHYTIRNGVNPSKHIYLDDNLVASKLDPSWFPHPPTLYFHSDHLGSAQYATNDRQELTQHDEFFPTGEIWERQTEGRYRNTRVTRFTGKELDEGTGLYYFGARWYDARQSQWISADPAFDQYMAGGVGNAIYAPLNLNVYAYAYNNPIRHRDPTGKIPIDTIWDAASIVYDVGKIGVGYATGNAALVAEGSVDLAADAVALAVPYVPAGSTKVARVLGKAATKVDDAGDAVKATAKGAKAAKKGKKGGKGARGGKEPVEKGKRGVEQAEQAAKERGETIKGREVTVELPSGKRSRVDLVTDDKGQVIFNEAKKGPKARLTRNQRELKETLEKGGTVIPRGRNAERAGLKPGRRVRAKFREQRFE